MSNEKSLTMKPYFTLALLLLLTFFIMSPAFGQQPEHKKPPTKEQVLEMTYEQLLNMPFEDLINLANIVGVSAEELLQMILNKEVSSASKSKETVFQSPLSTTVISKEELKASGALNIAEALRMVPGMVIREKTPGNFDVHIRGNDNIPPKNMYVYSEDAMSLIMIDGRPVYNYAFGGTFWETLPIDLNDVERIEVIRGPSSALYGPNAVAGVVNIITKQPEKNKITGDANIQMGNQQARILNGSIAGGVGTKLKFRVCGNYQLLDRFEKDFYVFDINQRLSFDQLDTLHSYWDPTPARRTMPAEFNVKDAIPDPGRGTDKYGVNAFLFFDLTKKIHIDFSTGIQQSAILSTTLGNHSIPLIGRTSHTKYVNLHSKIYGFDFQTNYMYGDQEIEQGNPAWHIDPKISNTQLEYEYRVGTFVLRPGIAYQNTIYSDKRYVDITQNEGFLNGDKKLNDISGFIRSEYTAFDKLRLIAALRADKYNVPDKAYFTYQFISTFNLNENNLIRGVVSRANRGPFIVDSYADFNWVLVPGNTYATGPKNYYSLHWEGTKDLKLPVMNMIELGFRTKPIKNLMVDIEGFRTVTKDFSYFLPDSMYLNADLAPMMSGQSPAVTGIQGSVRYYNFDLKTIQTGITCNISVAINSKLNFRVFGTLQQTKLYNFYPKTIWNNFTSMSAQAQQGLMGDVGKIMGGDNSPFANPYKVYTGSNTVNPDSLVDTEHKNTPTFFGGATIDFSPIKRLGIFTTLYYYTAQTILLSKVDVTDAYGASDMYKVQPKLIMSLKINFKVWKENSIFFNARNLLNSNKKEFAYTDKIGGVYMVGISLKF
jgi:iron complex outermembrane recepter protein